MSVLLTRDADFQEDRPRCLAKTCAIAFKHNPLSFHDKAHLAAEAAQWPPGEQGKFWQMHDKLFENQTGAGPRRA